MGGPRTAKGATVLALAFGLWALAVAITPFFPSAVPTAAIGLTFGWIGLRAGSVQGWRHAAIIGLAINALAVAVVLFIFVVLAL